VPKTCATWVDVLRELIFLVVTRSVSVLGLSRREWWWKDAEVLMLRHQLAVARRERVGADNPVMSAGLAIFL
jgi:hypothetical protein